MKAQKGSRGTAVLAELDGGGLSTPCHGRLNPGKILGTDCAVDWVGSKADLGRGGNKQVMKT